MIIKKQKDNTYICENEGQFFTIGSKEEYLAQKKEIESIPKPKEQELIELAKNYHPYYQRENSLANINNQLLEIEEFENGNDKL